MISLCLGHVLDPSILNWAHLEFARLNAGGFLNAARQIAEMAETLATNPYVILGTDNKASRAYDAVVSMGNWRRADKIYLDRLKAINPRIYLETLKMEGLAREFSLALAENVSRAKVIYRWITLAELASYQNGTFKSRVEENGGCRGYKPFSLGTNRYASERPMCITVPVNDMISNALRAAQYTAVPCPVLSIDEKIDSRKHLVHADETECRIPDGTCVPDGTTIIAQSRLLDTMSNTHRYYNALESLRDVVQVLIV